MNNSQGEKPTTDQIDKIQQIQHLLDRQQVPHYSKEEYRPFAGDPDAAFKRKAPSLKAKREIRRIQFDSVTVPDAKRAELAELYGWDLENEQSLKFEDTYVKLAEAVFVGIGTITDEQKDQLDDTEVKRAVEDFLSYTARRSNGQNGS